MIRPDLVFGLVTRVLRDPGYSEETTQDVYLQVWRNAANYDPSAGSPLAWLMTLAHRRAVDRVRSSRRPARGNPATAPPTSNRRRTMSPNLSFAATNAARSPNVWGR